MEQKRAELVVECLSVIKASLTTLRAIYDKLPQIINKENKAIAALEMAVVEDITTEKNLLSEAASANIDEIGKNFNKIFNNLNLAPPNDFGFADRINLIQSTIASEPTIQGLLAQILEHLCKECCLFHQDFKKAYENVQPIFEVHREVTSRRLAYFRESYHFWAGVERELTGAYDKKGQKTESGSGSLIQTRA